MSEAQEHGGTLPLAPLKVFPILNPVLQQIYTKRPTRKKEDLRSLTPRSHEHAIIRDQIVSY